VPTLYLVGTPIGNLEDISLRAVRVLKEVGLVAAEDTRRARVLFSRHGIDTPLTSYHEQGNRSRTPALLRALAEKDVALITEAGMPTISDPGFSLVRAAIEQGVPVEVVPGPSAVTSALALSGLPPDQFVFLGFLPRRAPDRRRLLKSVVTEPRTLVAFEAPHRLIASLRDIESTLDDRPIAVCRELTKLHEEVFRGTVSGAREYFAQPRGEFTLVIRGGQAASRPPDPRGVKERLGALRREGFKGREATNRVSEEYGLPRREVYRLWLETKR
jgi:16S rRNA (cytidine1402-2'-O)-methyltransferase